MHSLEARIAGFKFGKVQGKEAVEQAYRYAVDHLREPRTERTVIEDALMPREAYQQLFELYFSMQPDQAQTIVKQHRERFRGWRRAIEPLEKFMWSECRREQYKVAQKQYQRALQSNKQIYII